MKVGSLALLIAETGSGVNPTAQDEPAASEHSAPDI